MRNEITPRSLLNDELSAVEWSQRDTLAVRRAAEKGGHRSMKATTKLALTTIMLFVLLTSTALALVGHGLEWYYENRNTNMQANQPEKYEAIMANLKADVPQWVPEDPDVHIAVAETAWLPDQQTLVVSVMAAAAEPSIHELHPMWNLDADGAYVGEGGAENPASDGEDRAVHWLWTSNGFGPVEQMLAPGKTLLLLDTKGLYLGDLRLSINTDAYVTEDGMVHTVLESRFDEAQTAALLAADSDGDGSVTLTLPYTVTHYTTDDQQLYSGGRTGEIRFEVKIH